MTIASRTETFLQKLKHTDYFVQDHRVHQICTLPGVVLLDMIYRLSSKALGTQSIELHHVVFKQPIVTSEQFDIDILVSFTTHDTHTDIIVSSRKVYHAQQSTKENDKVINMECSLHPIDTDSSIKAQSQMPLLKKQAAIQWDMDKVYGLARQSDIHHYDFMKNSGTVYQQGDNEWMHLQISSIATPYIDKFYAHVALLDGATFAGTSFRWDEQGNERSQEGFKPYIPFMIERFVIYRSLPERIYTHTVQTKEDLVADADIIKRHISIYDDEGNVLATFENLTAKRIREARLITGLVDPMSTPVAAIHSKAEHFTSLNSHISESPLTQIEQFLQLQLADILMTEQEQIDSETGFYELGLDSIKLLELVTFLEQYLQIELYPTLLFEYSTVATLAAYLNDHWQDAFLKTYTQSRSFSNPLVESDTIDTFENSTIAYQPVWEVIPISTSSSAKDDAVDRMIILYTPSQVWKKVLSDHPKITHITELQHELENIVSYLPSLIEQIFTLIQQHLQTNGHRPTVIQIVADRSDRTGTIWGLEGMFKTIAQEYPFIQSQLILFDVESVAYSDQIVERLDEEFEQSSIVPSISIHYQGHRLERHIRNLQEVTLLDSGSHSITQHSFRNGGVYLIIGGMGGLGYELAKHIADRTHTVLILIGRSPLSDSLSLQLELLRSKGSEAIYIQTDISKHEDVENMVHLILAKYSTINGVFHCAGIIQDKLMIQKSLTELHQTLQPKIQGFIHLDQVLSQQSLDFFVVFSSLSAVVGNIGQSDYAVANGYLDQLVLERALKVKKGQRSGGTYTINWQLWEQGGMQVSDAHRQLMYKSGGMVPLPTDEGFHMLDLILKSDAPQLAILYGDAEQIRSRIQEHRSESSVSSKNNDSSPQQTQEDHSTDIAIIGVGGRYPDANTIEQLYENLKAGKDSITTIPEHRWASNHTAYSVEDYYRYGSFVDRIDDFDPLFFNISPYQAERMDPQARLFLQTVWEACEDAGFAVHRNQHDYSASSSRSVGVFAGVFWNHYELYSAEMSQQGRPSAFGTNSASIANMVSYHLNFHGPSMALDSMCSSSLTAVHLACESIKRGECHYAVAGGVNLVTHPHKYVFLKEAQFLSSEGKCRSFGKDGDGYVPGEGVGAVLMTSVAEAKKQGHPIYAVIKGSALNHSGRTSGATVPDPVAQSEVILNALAAAHIDPSTLSYIETHGTGTSLGDPIELQALERAFRKAGSTQQQFCAIGSLKSNIGHLEAAAGIAGLTKLLLQFKHQEIFPSLHAEPLNPLIPFGSTSFYVQHQGKVWERPTITDNNSTSEIPLRAGISSFGANGSNAHVIVEEYVPVPSNMEQQHTINHQSSVIIPLSAQTEERLQVYAQKLLDFVHTADTSLNLCNLAYTFQLGRTEMKARVAFNIADIADLKQQLNTFIQKTDIAPIQPTLTIPDQQSDRNVFISQLIAKQEWNTLAHVWMQGVKIDWTILYPDHVCQLIHAPTYPFRTNRYWVPDIDSASLSNEQQISNEPKVPLEEVKSEEVAVSSLHEESIEEHVSIKSLSIIEEQVKTWIKTTAAKILKVQMIDIENDVELSEYGFDSILFTQLADQFNHQLQTDLTPAHFFEQTTIQQITVFLIDQYSTEIKQFFSDAIQQRPEPMKRNNTNLSTSSKSKESSLPKSGVPVSSSLPVDHQEPIAIIGMSAKFPQAEDIDQFWDNLVSGKDCIGEIPSNRWDWKKHFGDPNQNNYRTNIKWGGFIEGIDEFDPLFFGIAPREAVHMDPQQRLLMMYVWKAIEDAGYAASSLAGSQLGIFVGTGSSGYNVMMAQANEQVEAYSITANVPSVGPNRMSHFLNVHGPSQPIETACSSSLVAIHRAVNAIRSGDCDTAVTGGVNTILSLDAHISLNKAGMLSPDGRCKTFSAQADGYARGEGVGMIFLKKLTDAQADGDHIYGVIRGSYENHGGKAGSLTAPNPKAQTALLKTAFLRSGISPDTISFIETHGTGTPLGDPIEINTLKSAFQASPEESTVSNHAVGYCGIGSVKSNIGHLEMAAGIAGVIKVLLQMKHQKLVKSLHAEIVNPYIHLENSPFYIVNETQDWQRLRNENGQEIPRRAGVSSFGFGGSNAHVVLEEYIPETSQHHNQTESPHQPVLFVLSAVTKERLDEQIQQWIQVLQQNHYTDAQLSDMAYTLQVGRDAFDIRFGCIVSSIDELKEKLQAYVISEQPIENVYTGDASAHKSFIALFKADEELSEAVHQWMQRSKYHKLLEVWVKGIDVNWSAWYKDSQMQRISLPTYPFSKEKYWVNVSSFSEKRVELQENHISKSQDQENQEGHTSINSISPKVEVDAVVSIQKQITTILADLLGVADTSIQADVPLDRYGMNSILILQMLQKFQSHIDPSIQLEDIVECNTIEELVAALPVDSIDIHSDSESIAYSELIHLNAVTTGQPIFWIHGGTGGVESYLQLATQLNRPFYGIQAKGYLNDEPPLQSIYAMAAYYTRIIRDIQPEGPYDVGGYSLGGILAYEIIRILQTMEQEVSSIVMIDSFYPDDSNLQWNTEHPYLWQMLYPNGSTASKEKFIDTCYRLEQAYELDQYQPVPLLDSQSIRSYYFRNQNGIFVDENSTNPTDYWQKWRTILPHLHIVDIDTSNHFVMLSEQKSLQQIMISIQSIYTSSDISHTVSSITL
ncbi:Polyketide synthase PksL [Paenibacillus nuruki]|uniref:Polyketide synthase PksL n=2 Tax=Paenibacillus nuruki TaxID=1886670 RepID=A0A1E3L454_9BACL|nr:SDR family NAD(P)-dependent oxidoreductase [Paenibacillus nuruki]ODP28423.1 Polyketide synthase PksL [Paenibacillus nuruki]